MNIKEIVLNFKNFAEFLQQLLCIGDDFPNLFPQHTRKLIKKGLQKLFDKELTQVY